MSGWRIQQGLILLVSTILAGAVGLLLAKTSPKTYSSTSVVMVISNSAASGDSSATAYLIQQQVQTLSDLAETPFVLDQAVKAVPGLTSADAQVRAAGTLTSTMINITAQGATSSDSIALANSVATQLGEKMKDVVPTDAQGRPLLKITTVAPASEPGTTVAPKPRVWAVGGGVLGCLVSLSWLLAASARRSTSSLTEALEQADGVAFVRRLKRGLLPWKRNASFEDCRQLLLDVLTRVPEADPLRFLIIRTRRDDALLKRSLLNAADDLGLQLDETRYVPAAGAGGLPEDVTDPPLPAEGDEGRAKRRISIWEMRTGTADNAQLLGMSRCHFGLVVAYARRDQASEVRDLVHLAGSGGVSTVGVAVLD